MTRRASTTSADQARARAEQQHREIEAATGGRFPDAPPRQAGSAQLFTGPCSEHPSQMVDGRSGRCALCGLNGVHKLRAELFDNAAAPPTKRMV